MPSEVYCISVAGQQCLQGIWFLQVDQAAHANLEAVLWRDTAFLAGLGVMDYSLLVGLDSHTHRLVIGIIDFIRQVTMPPSVCLHSHLSRAVHSD